MCYISFFFSVIHVQNLGYPLIDLIHWRRKNLWSSAILCNWCTKLRISISWFHPRNDDFLVNWALKWLNNKHQDPGEHCFKTVFKSGIIIKLGDWTDIVLWNQIYLISVFLSCQFELFHHCLLSVDCWLGIEKSLIYFHTWLSGDSGKVLQWSKWCQRRR